MWGGDRCNTHTHTNIYVHIHSCCQFRVTVGGSQREPALKDPVDWNPGPSCWEVLELTTDNLLEAILAFQTL